ncbi:MAG: HAD family hydrolase [Nocardioides sp.]|nr:HAD family hydrolase [Nocardioides sp.]
MMIDLDNTLVDRAAAFRTWAELFHRRYVPADPSAVAWLVHADADGYEPRDRLALSVRDRFGLSPRAYSELVNDLRQGMADHLEVDPQVPAALKAARTGGWTVAVVTNGDVEQQERKLRLTKLDEEVDTWVISAAVGVKKPDPEIFRHAARSAGTELDGAWMIGDSAHADIAGAYNLSLRSVWVRRGRPWQEEAFAPTMTADTCQQAIELAVASSPA